MPRILSDADIAEFRDRLCEVATRQFAAHGPDGVTMRALARELGVSPMTPYRYFKDKDEILAAVQARAFDRFAEALESPMDAPGTAETRANAVGAAYARFAFEDPEAYRLMFEIPLPKCEAYPDLDRATERARKSMTGYVKALVNDGLLQGDPELIGHVFWATMHGAVMLKLANKLSSDCDFDRIVEAAFTALGRGFQGQS